MERALLWVALLLITALLCACGSSLPAAGEGEQAPTEFIFLSDTQALPADSYTASDYADYAALLAQAREAAPGASVLLLGGDTVNDGGDEAEWQAFFAAGGQSWQGLTVLAAEGNHDRRGLVYEKFSRPPGASFHRGSFWSWDCGDAHFLVLDSSLMGAALQEDIDWVRQDLAACRSRFIVALMHHPAYPALAWDKDVQRAQVMQEYFLPLFETYGVDLVLCGHQHLYMRTVPQNGVTYVMLASGPKEYAAAEPPEQAAVLLEQPAFLIGRIEAEGLCLEVYGADGLLDSFVIE